MRSIFGVLSLVIVLAIVGFLAKKQMGSVNAIQVPMVVSPGDSNAAGTAAIPMPGGKLTGNAQSQSQQLQQQFKAAAEAYARLKAETTQNN